MKLNTLFVFTACSACSFAGVASASTVDVQLNGSPCGENVATVLNGNGRNGYAGQLGLTLTNSTGTLGNGNYIGFCTELTQTITIGGAPQQYCEFAVADLPVPGAGMGAAKADAIARMWLCAGGLQFTGDSTFCAAFQVAIWEIVYDGNWDLSSGNFTATSNGAAMDADLAFLCAWAFGNGPMAALTGLGSDDYQDQIVPGPGSLALLGVAGLLGTRRRRS